MLAADENDGEVVYSVVGDRYRYLLTGDQTAGTCFMFEAYVPAGNGPPPHLHRREDEAFYVVEGEFEFTVNGEPIRMGAGGFLRSPRGEPHYFKNVGSTPGKLIITLTPAGLEHFFTEVGTKLAHGNDAPVAPTAQDIEKLVRTSSKYGLELLHG
jgi:quercetin dioxygenase-like cupin family protein